MARVPQQSDGKGSLKHIQDLINKNEDIINSRIKSQFKELKTNKITWVSPIEADNYAEYSDEDFLRKVGLIPIEFLLGSFWPKRGPQWDALATTENGAIILVEAKAHVSELKSDGTKATGNSLNLIHNSLNETKRFLDINNVIDWSEKYYQYANRLAHLYFFKEKLHYSKVFLINIYFLEDMSVKRPVTKQQWRKALKALKKSLGLCSQHILSEYMADIFIDVKELK
jgi:hypothetical protein